MRMFKFSFLFFPILLLCINSFGQTPKYHKAKVFFDDKPNGLAAIAKLGIATDHGQLKRGVFFISDFSDQEISLLRSEGFKFEILIEDVSSYYVNRNNYKSAAPASSQDCGQPGIAYETPANFNLGSMGGFFTYSEMLSHLDLMTSKYPNLISVKQSLGNSYENRPIYYLRISDNPSSDENEPEVLYTAVHHAREPASLSQLIFYMWYLLENYNSDDMIKNLVDNTELYFVPCVNPDGYYYNQTTDPNGGGMWRKNRKNNGNGTFGVDLNRNYGYYWGFDDVGSSNSTSSDTYRGTAGFSEPETQAIKTFCENHQFKLALNHHTYGNLLIYPWGYQESLFTPDSAAFVSYAEIMTSENHYVYGTGDQTVGYVTNGDSDDWMYGEQSSKNKILSMTPEGGDSDDGFWPAETRIIDICKGNIYQNLNLALFSGSHAKAEDISPFAFSSMNIYAGYRIKRFGMQNSSFTVSLIPHTNVSSAGTSKVYSSLTQLEEKTDSIAITLSPSIQGGQTFSYILKVDNGAYSTFDTITKIYGTQNTSFADNGSSLTNWTSSSWNTINGVYYSASSSITDSPFGDYDDNTNTSIVLKNAIDLKDASSAYLSFYGKWEIEQGWDYAQVFISDDNGSSWVAACGKYTKTGNENQSAGEPVYDGNQVNWVKEEINLADYIGKSILIKFQLISDQFTTGDGFYFDDLKVEIIKPVPAGINSNEKNISWTSQNIPNPANTYTYINYNMDSKATNPALEVYDLFGKLIFSSPLQQSSGSYRLNTEEYSAGIYLYRFTAVEFKSGFKKMVVIR